MKPKLTILVPIAIVALAGGVVWWFVFRETKADRVTRLLAAARQAMNIQDYATAERDLLEALKVAPNNGLMLHNLAILYLQEKRLPQAREAFRRAVAAHGPQANEVRADDLFQLASISYAEKNWKQAAIELEQAIQSHPQRAQLHTRLLDLQLGPLHDLPAADSTVSRFLRVCGRTPGNLENVAFVLYQRQNYARAEELASEAFASSDSAITAHVVYARSLWRQDRLADGLKSLDGPLARHPSSVDLWVTKGILLVEARRPDEALAVANRAVAIAPSSFDAHELLQKVYANQGRLQDALREIDVARELTQDPNDQRRLVSQSRAIRNLLQATNGTGVLKGTAVPDSAPASP
jgi:tetratricopeptide (TPR) repeat protein